jgi:hypothetical protein
MLEEAQHQKNVLVVSEFDLPFPSLTLCPKLEKSSSPHSGLGFGLNMGG